MIETTHLLLRALRDDDLAAYTAIWAKPSVVRYLPSESDTTQAAETAASFIGQWGERAWLDGYWPWAVVERASGRLIGHAGLRFSPGLDAPELLYMLDDSVWGRGYASEAANAACEFARDRLNLAYVAAVALADNAGSVGVLRKAGFAFEGETMSDSYRVVRYGRRLAA
jgi:RimJ/RimL family protein N-acetyltransferase